MADDIRYTEFKFLQAVDRRDPKLEYVSVNNAEQKRFVGLHQLYFAEMLIALAEDWYIEFDNDNFQALFGRLRGEIAPDCPRPSDVQTYEWANPRQALHNRLVSSSFSFRLRTTYRGVCRVEEL